MSKKTSRDFDKNLILVSASDTAAGIYMFTMINGGGLWRIEIMITRFFRSFRRKRIHAVEDRV